MKKHWSSNGSFLLGIVSIFLWKLSIFPILAIAFGWESLRKEGRNWKAWAGISLGILFLIVSAWWSFTKPL